MELPVDGCSLQFYKNKHIMFCVRCLQILPQSCEFLDSNRVRLCLDKQILNQSVFYRRISLLVVAYFATSCLDLLGGLSKLDNEREKIIDWVYSLQVLPDENEDGETDFGFISTTTCSVNNQKAEVCDKAHITFTYAALCILVILKDDLVRVDKKNIILSLKKLQLPDGSFRPMNIECENDMRFVYCAACICYILQDWSGMDIEKTVDYIQKSINYDGGIGQAPGLESHAGSTFCAVASLYLMGKLDTTVSPKQMKSLKRWLTFRQDEGFHGRPNKPDDTCYTFWVGATLKILDCYNFIDYPTVLEFVLSAQDEIVGGIGKWWKLNPDLLHTYLSISGLSLASKTESLSIFPALNISNRAVEYLNELHRNWGTHSMSCAMDKIKV